MAENETSLTDILDALKRAGERDTVSVDAILQTFEHRSLGVLLTLFSLIAALPLIGDIPGVSIVTGTLILMVVGQAFLGRGGLWMPDFVRRRRIKRETWDRGIEKSRGWVRWVDGLVKPRLAPLVVGRKRVRMIALTAAVLAVTFYPLAFVPFGVNAPATAVLALGLGLVTGDGLLVLIGYVLAGATAAVLIAVAL